ncbi:hypothetical protein [Dietzia timorensis]|uniref:Uncharacterized protein n=1 Tax=Dietzia timorensis TaxID=499555 RepID=A0A173LL93_9ACTN|nr:hypothetical protein [Dietzia timorensis]ANI92354.1 Hypothetical protein BJL86_1577 [Dietzia timorensis]
MELNNARKVSSAAVSAFGLVGGYLVARETGIRPLGGVVLAAAGIYAGRTWKETSGPATTAVLGGTYIGAFGASHPLAKKIGAWPAIAAVTAATSGLSYALVDSKN